jgi:hypothetical protein
MKHNNMSPVGEFVKSLMASDSSAEELRIAQENVDEFMAVLVRIYHRLEAEGKFGEISK